MEDPVKYNVTVFIDTNVILEGKELKDLPWMEIHPSGPILVLLLPTLLREVDLKKRDGRLGVRARNFNRFITPLASGAEAITIRSESPRVDLALAICRKIDWDLYDELDPNEGDARLVAEALHVKELPDGKLILMSQDINPLVLSRRHGLETLHLSESWLASPELSPHEKELARLKRQVADYAKTEPMFAIKSSLPTEPTLIYQVESLGKTEIDSLQSEILAKNPRPNQEQSSLHSVGLTGAYDYTLNNRYDEYANEIVPNFVIQLHEKLELLLGQVPFSFCLTNTGKVRAENMHVEVRSSYGWLNRKVIVSAVFPSAPRVRNSPLMPDFTNFHRPEPSVGRHEVEVDEVNKSKIFSAQCADFRQGQIWEFDGVLWLDPKISEPATVIITVTSANFHGEFQQVLKVAKNIQQAKVFDLIQRDGKVNAHPHISQMFKDAADSENYDLIEWDNPTLR